MLMYALLMNPCARLFSPHLHRLEPFFQCTEFVRMQKAEARVVFYLITFNAITWDLIDLSVVFRHKIEPIFSEK